MQKLVLKSIDSLSELYFRRKVTRAILALDVFSLEFNWNFSVRANHGFASWPPQQHQFEFLPECTGDYGLVLWGYAAHLV